MNRAFNEYGHWPGEVQLPYRRHPLPFAAQPEPTITPASFTSLARGAWHDPPDGRAIPVADQRPVPP